VCAWEKVCVCAIHMYINEYMYVNIYMKTHKTMYMCVRVWERESVCVLSEKKWSVWVCECVRAWSGYHTC